MTKNFIKLLVSGLLLIAFVGLSVMFTLKNVSITDSFKFLSVEGLIARKDDVLKKEEELVAQQQSYASTLSKLQSAQSDFNREKNKYEAISDETIEIIKEATTKQNYNMEYMWIKLGNYARANNLSLLVIEPGANDEVLKYNSETNKEEENSTTTTTTTTSSSSEQEVEEQENSTDTNLPNIQSNTNVPKVQNSTTSDDTMKIQLEGSYIDISDFVFEVENDAELKFKLDNIFIEYVEGTTIRATFDIKNTIIVK